ncbi:MAG TPA: AmmeMemoRadiSam system protein B [Spirochaetota bacterium]|nr:AmmeMemoRadiSam system protein B [Spirochaetota bacterium]HNT10763.1 AmmeMemoRadiSam system protein B [Spirochaetota bacterium]
MNAKRLVPRICVVLFLCAAFACSADRAATQTRPSALAGKWYPSSPAELSREIDGLLDSAARQPSIDNPLVFILPHAGYRYSGAVAAAGYRLMRETAPRPDIIVIIAPSHYGDFSGCSTLAVDYFETPLGPVRVDTRIARDLLDNHGFADKPSLHAPEHAVEIHLPFLQRIYGTRLERDAPILPILTGTVDERDATRIAAVLASVLRTKRAPVIIISTDFTHYGRRFGYLPFAASGMPDFTARMAALDRGAIDPILARTLPAFARYVRNTGITVCGKHPIMIALALPIADAQTKLLAYDTSARITGDYATSVSYASIAIAGALRAADIAAPAPDHDDADVPLTRADKQSLLSIARKNIQAHLSGSGPYRPPADGVTPAMRSKRGLFVTLKVNDELRGCIGTVTDAKSIIDATLDNSFNAAFRDPRFPPLRRDELGLIRIEISVLTEPRPVGKPGDVVVGRDGLIMERGSQRGLLLPQVPVELGWDRNTFLSHACGKSGLPPDCWRDSRTKIKSFRAIVFGEPSKR